MPARDATHATAYRTMLGWPVARGHRFQPRGGCTCRDEASPSTAWLAPGARPFPRWSLMPTERIYDEFEAPGVSVITPTQPFDAVVYPRQLGMAIMVHLDRRGPVPRLTARDHATLLVLPGAGCLLRAPGCAAEVRAGAGNWIASPPHMGCAGIRRRWTKRPGPRSR